MNKTGFGFLRPPRLDAGDEKSTDYALLNTLVDRFLELGGTYFDTAYTYLGGASEEAIRRCLVERHPRDSFQLADKLPGYQVKSREECQTYLEESLRRCGVAYFDVYLLHWLNEKNYALAEQYGEFAFLQECKANGKARKIGFSYHDSPQLLDTILTAHPEVDYVQLQINYLDWDSPSLEARKCYEVACKHGKSVIVMEPVKGGSLVKLPQEAEVLLKSAAPEESTAFWAIRFAASLPQVSIVLSGMNAMEQIEDNLRPFSPLTAVEREILDSSAKIIRANTAVPCTGCGYCLPHCPIEMPIPRYFSLYNEYARNPDEDWKMQHAYDTLTNGTVAASACLSCRQCQEHCPQKLTIPEYLQKAAGIFEK